MRKYIISSVLVVWSCKPTQVSSVKDDDPSPGTGTAGSGAQVAGDAAQCAAATLEGGQDARYAQDLPGTTPTDLLAAPAPAWSTQSVDPNGEKKPAPCTNPDANGPTLNQIKLNPKYTASTGSTNGSASLRLDDDPDPTSPAAATAATPTATSTATSTDTGGKVACIPELPNAKLLELYGQDLSDLPGCQDDGFTAWLSKKTGKTLDAPTAPTAGAEPVKDTRASYETGVYKLLSDVKTIESNGATGLVDPDPWSLLSDRDPVTADPQNLPDPLTATGVGINEEIDDLQDDWDQLAEMTTLLAGDPATNTDPNTAVALADPGGQNAPKDTNGLKTWTLGNDRFNIGFSLAFGAQFGQDTSAGYEQSDKALQPSGGERSPKMFVYKEYSNLKQSNASSGLSVGGGPAMDVTLFGKKFAAVGKAYVTGNAFNTTTVVNSTDSKFGPSSSTNKSYSKNGIELGFQLFGATLWKKNYLGCDADKGTCKEGKADDGSMRQKLAWLGRAAKGRYYFTIGPIPMDAQWEVAPYIGYSWNIALTMDAAGMSAQLAAGFFPRAKAGVSLSGGVNFVGQRAGVRGDLTLFNIGPTGVMGATAVLSGGNLSFCPFVKSEFQYQFLDGALSAYAELWYVFGSKYFQLQFYHWDGWKGALPLYTPAQCSSATPAPAAQAGQPAAPAQPNVLDQVNQAADAQKPRQIKLKGTNQCLDENMSDTRDQKNVILYGCNGQPNQLWTISADGTITNGASGNCLDGNKSEVEGGGGSAKLLSYQCHGDLANNRQQMWQYDASTGLIKNAGNPALCLDADSTDHSSTRRVFLYSCHSPIESQQQWAPQ